MIKSFKHKGIEEFFYTGNKKGIRPEHAGRFEIILDRLNAANKVKDMNYPGSNLHKLTGDKKGLYAVRYQVIGEYFLNSLMEMPMLSIMTIIINEVIL